MIKNCILIILLFSVVSCRKHYDVQIPDTRWDLFEAASLVPLPQNTRIKSEGVYSIGEGSDMFGSLTALKWTYNANGADTTYYLSMFCQKDVSYFILQGRRQDSTILLNGYWRKMSSTATGKARFTIASNKGGTYLLSGATSTTDSLVISGLYGSGDAVPGNTIRLSYLRPLYNAKPLEMVVHRGGGQTADLLPASENTAEIIQYASRFGATGIEIDVHLTKDGVPVLFHDVDLSERLIVKNGMVGPIENYTYAQLNDLVRLIRNGEHIPTLRQAMDAMVYKTPLDYVWWDTKNASSVPLLRQIQQEYLQKAAAIGRHVEITIGIPDQAVLTSFLAMPDHQNVPSVCELDPQYVEQANSLIWGPRWTLGLQSDKVAAMHAQGRKVFVWTLDIPENMDLYMKQGNFDGILTDYPSALAYLFYVQQ